MKLVEHLQTRSPYERTFHAISYEVVGIITSAPIIAFFTGKGLSESGVIALLVSIIATLWNYIYNLGYDKLRERFAFKKNLFVRILHGTFFEMGLIFLTVPAIALTMGLSMLAAFKLEVAMLFYFFPYTIVFNWGYDKLKAYAIERMLVCEK